MLRPGSYCSRFVYITVAKEAGRDLIKDACEGGAFFVNVDGMIKVPVPQVFNCGGQVSEEN
jgi:hypothetical protein